MLLSPWFCAHETECSGPDSSAVLGALRAVGAPRRRAGSARFSAGSGAWKGELAATGSGELYVLMESQRAQLKKLLQKHNNMIKLEPRIIAEDKGRESDQFDIDVIGQHSTKEPVSSLLPPLIQDSEWFTLNPQEKLAWAKTSKDPRVAAGQQSPLEKKILNLGGMHTTAARHLLTQKHQEEYEALCREQACSLDYWLAKAESYYNKRMMDIMKKEATGNEIKMKVEEETTRSVEGQKHYCVVPERERKQIERHVHRTGQARGFKNGTSKQPQPLSDTLPKIMPEKHGIQKAQRKQVNEREQMQIKDHQERMIRGRELTEQRLKERILRKSQSQPPARAKYERAQKETREFERVTAYPLFQPCGRSRVQVTVLMEKSQRREKVDTVLKSCERKYLALPPFLERQIEK